MRITSIIFLVQALIISYQTIQAVCPQYQLYQAQVTYWTNRVESDREFLNFISEELKTETNQNTIKSLLADRKQYNSRLAESIVELMQANARLQKCLQE